MIKLSKRLAMSASMVSAGGVVADVGCDHAHTCIYLLEEKIAKRCIAMDVRTGPLGKAKGNLALHDCLKNTELRLSNGLEKLQPDEADTIIIAGMGGLLTVEILEAGLETALSARELILQPQSHIYEVRCFLYQHGFDIVDESMCYEEEKYYTTIKAMPLAKGKNLCELLATDDSCKTKAEADGGQNSSDLGMQENLLVNNELAGEALLEFGPILIERRNSILKAYLQSELEKVNHRIEQIDKSKTEEADAKKNYFINRRRLVDWVLAQY